MNKTFVTGLLVVLAAGTAFAQESRPPRVGVIDMARVSAESQLGKSYAGQLEKLQNDINSAATQKQAELGKMDAGIKSLQDELEKQGAVLSAEARDKKQQDITRRTRERQAYLEDGQAEINRMRERAQQQAQSINNEFQLKVRPIVEQVAKEKGYDLVLDSQVAFTINKDFDITPQVIARADEQAKAAGAAAPAPAPGAGATAAPKAGPATPKPAPPRP
ncbi:MAG TPA: OmpH family outer membrane protein [Vicinamibacteria bacterium]|nr:OmpH family outer membrane protein [Vicinamibacteria bacterium]